MTQEPSGFPDGNPKENLNSPSLLDSPTDLEDAHSLLRQYRIQAIQTLGEVLTTGKGSEQLTAAESILNRTGLPQTKTTIHENPSPSIDPETLKTIFTGISKMFLSASARSSSEDHTPIKDITPQKPSLSDKNPSLSNESKPKKPNNQNPKNSKNPKPLTETYKNPKKSPKPLTKTYKNSPHSPKTGPSARPKEVPEEILNSLSKSPSGDYI